MLTKWNTYLRDESGAVTVDWVVLTAGIVGLGLAVAFTIAPGLTTNSGSLHSQLENELIATSFD